MTGPTARDELRHFHPPETYFDRSLCPKDDWMHTRCAECGTPLDGECGAALAAARSEAPGDRQALWEKWTGGERLAYGCGLRDGRSEAPGELDAARVHAALDGYCIHTHGAQTDSEDFLLCRLVAARLREARIVTRVGVGSPGAPREDERLRAALLDVFDAAEARPDIRSIVTTALDPEPS